MVLNKLGCALALMTLFLLLSCSSSDKTVLNPTDTSVPVANTPETIKSQNEAAVPNKGSHASGTKVSLQIQPGTIARYKIGDG